MIEASGLMFVVALLLTCSWQVEATLTPSTVTACPDDPVILTCTLPGSFIRWMVTTPQNQQDSVTLSIMNPAFNIFAFRGVLTDSSGGMLTATLTSLSVASTVEGTMVVCFGESSQEGPLTITVAEPPSPPLNTRVSSTQSQPSSSNITLEWDVPSSTGGVSVSYVLIISPTPLSGSPVTMETTSAQITVSYNIPYNVTIRAVNCIGMSNASMLLTIPSIVACPSSLSVASGVANVQIPSLPTLNSILTFTCFEDNQMVTSTCGSDGQWNPDPEDFMCPTMEPPVTCLVPVAPSMGNVSISGQSYIEGSQVIYQCNDGLFPMGVLNATCTRDTGDRQNGVWEPDPGAVVCRTSPVNCTVPAEPSNGTIVDYEKLNETVLEGTVLTYQCDNGLSLTGPNTITCTNAGVWSTEPEAIMCVRPTKAQSPTLFTGTDLGIAVSVSVIVTAALFMIIGFLTGVLVMYLCSHKKAVYSPSVDGQANVRPTVPAGPVYEEVSPKEEIELNTNQAYGPIGL